MLNPKQLKSLTEIALLATCSRIDLQNDTSLLRWPKSSLNPCAWNHERHLMSAAKTIYLHVFDKVENSPFAGAWRKMILAPLAIACMLRLLHHLTICGFLLKLSKSHDGVSPLFHRFHSIRQTLDNLRIHG